MKRPLKNFLALSFAFLTVAALFYLVLPVLFKPELIKEKTLQKVQEITGNTPRFAQASVSYFPSLNLAFYDFNAEWAEEKLQLKAEQVKINLSLVDFIFGRLKISRLSIREGTIDVPAVSFFGVALGKFQVTHARLALRPLEENKPVKFELEGQVSGLPKSFTSRGQITLDSLKPQGWEAIAFEGKIELEDLDLSALDKNMTEAWPFKVDSGKSGGEIGFSKKKNDPWVELTGGIKLQDFVYRTEQNEKILTSAPLQADLQLDLSWNPQTDEFMIKRSYALTSLGEFQAQGNGLLGAKEIKEMRILASGMILENIPQHWVSLKEQIPLNVGFSGMSDLEISLKGKWDDLSVSANMDLTPAILTYAHFFSKAKDIPLNLSFDCLLLGGEILSGNFSVRLQETNIKGTFADFNLRTHEGQINVITNKFPVAGWESLLIPFQNYELQGEMKILANWKGSFDKAEDLKTIFNLSLENGSLIPKKNGTPVRNIRLSLDYGGIGLMLKEAKFEVADSPVLAEALIYGLFKSPAVKAKISSPHLKPLTVITALQDWASEWNIPGMKDFFEGLHAPVENFFASDSAVENLLSEFQYDNKKWTISRLDFEAYKGEIKIQGGLDLNQEAPVYQVKTEINRLNLVRFLSRKKQEAGTVEGNLSLKMDLHGEAVDKRDWLDSAEGEGSLLIHDGFFQTFDLLGAISRISELKELKRYASDRTAFDDFDLQFHVKNKKMLADKFVLVSSRVLMEGSGDIGFDGLLNCRLNVYLPPEVLQELLVPKFFDQAAVKGKQFGPIPMLLSGPLTKPELQPDPEAIPQLLEYLIKGKSHKILRDFLPETFLPRRTNS